jgi:uncharacterized protein YkwD
MARRTALAIAMLVGLASVATLAIPARSLAWDGNSFDTSAEAELIALTNRSRASAGLKALKVDPALTSIARWRSKDMIENDYFSHSIPGYGKVFDKLDETRYCYKLAGENIGWNTNPDDQATTAIHQMFMDSAGHRSIILGEAWDAIGVGAYKGSGDKKMWTVLFADTCGGSTPPTPDPTPKPTLKPTPTPDPTPSPTPKPKATPKPTSTPEPALTPEPTVTPPPTPDATAEVMPTPAPEATPTPTPVPAPAPTPMPAANASVVRMRVVDGGASGSLFDMIVTGVTGFFFGV